MSLSLKNLYSDFIFFFCFFLGKGLCNTWYDVTNLNVEICFVLFFLALLLVRGGKEKYGFSDRCNRVGVGYQDISEDIFRIGW